MIESTTVGSKEQRIESSSREQVSERERESRV
jgi:hypothetical protein